MTYRKLVLTLPSVQAQDIDPIALTTDKKQEWHTFLIGNGKAALF